MKALHGRRFWALPLALLIVGFLAVTSTTAEAADETIPPHSTIGTSQQQTATLRLDCSRLATPAKQYAKNHHYCPSKGEVSTSDIRGGACGISSLFIDDKGNGNARIYWSVYSYWGSITHRSLNVSWLNYSQGNTGWYTDQGYMFSSYYGASRTFYTRSGNVLATLSGSVTLGWGGRCYVLNPSDSTEVH
jgi:hypothetical protein